MEGSEELQASRVKKKDGGGSEEEQASRVKKKEGEVGSEEEQASRVKKKEWGAVKKNKPVD